MTQGTALDGLWIAELVCMCMNVYVNVYMCLYECVCVCVCVCLGIVTKTIGEHTGYDDAVGTGRAAH